MTANSLTEKLRALGVQIGARNLAPPRIDKANGIENVVPGRLQATPHGDTFVAHAEFAGGTRHGASELYVQDFSLRALAGWVYDTSLEGVSLDRIAFLDTETTGLARGPGTYAFLVGVGCFCGDTFCTTQFFMRDPSQEPALLYALAEYLSRHQALVTFNGKGYDVPLLNARYTLHAETSPMASLAHLDLLPVARRLWRERLASRSLGSLEAHILGVRRTEQDMPGWMIPSLYFDYQRTGDARPLKGVFYHNEIDILSMVSLLHRINMLLQAPRSQIHELDLVGLARAYEYMGDAARATQTYAHALDRGLPSDVHRRVLKRLSFIHKRQGELGQAMALWVRAAREGMIYAHVELAKLYEHRERDYAAAQRWTQAAIDRVIESGAPAAQCEQRLAELRHRLDRLCAKKARQEKHASPAARSSPTNATGQPPVEEKE